MVSARNVAALIDDNDDDDMSVTSFSNEKQLKSSHEEEEDTSMLVHDAKKATYKPRPLTAEEKEKLVVEQAELFTFFTLLYSATALAIAVRLLTKEDEVEEFEKGVSGSVSVLGAATRDAFGLF